MRGRAWPSPNVEVEFTIRGRILYVYTGFRFRCPMMSKDPLPLKPSWSVIPLFQSSVVAGFPSPADDYIEASLSLDELCVVRPAATFFLRSAGHSMTGAGIFDGDILIVDRSIEARPGRVVVANFRGDFTCKIYELEAGAPVLRSAHPDYPPIRLLDGEDLEVFGVVTFCIHRLDGEAVRSCSR